MDTRLPAIIGESNAVDRLRKEVDQAARSSVRVLITGESGTGKEVAARLIHARSARAFHPMITINCAGLTETLLESELFGHQRGSFTGATRDTAGLLERAHLGTVLLDEVGEMSPRMQGMLLRFLETGEIHRVGGDGPVIRLDVRVIAATNRDLAGRVASGDFRLDLFYRLDVLRLQTPALRDRPEDIAPLFSHFLGSYARRAGIGVPPVTLDALARLRHYSWPGNVRQLKNIAERLIVRAPGGITVADLSDDVLGPRLAPVTAAPSRATTTADRLLARIQDSGESFWEVVYGPFMSRDLTRADLRALVVAGLERTRRNYSALVRLLNMPRDDERRFQNFLRKHQCQIDSREFAGEPSPIDCAADTRRLVGTR